MRELTPQEKQVVRALISDNYYQKGNSLRLGELITKIFPVDCIKPATQINNLTPPFISISYDRTNVEFSAILDAIHLMDLLVEKKYLILTEFIPNNGIIGIDKHNNHYEERSIINFDNRDLWNFLNHHYYVTNALIDFAKDFKTIQQRNFEEQQCSAWMGVGVAVVVGVASILIGISTKNTPTTINDEQLIRIETAIKSTMVDTTLTQNIDSLTIINPMKQ